VTETPPELELRPLAGLDRGRVARWLRSPVVADWLGGPASAEARVRLAADVAGAICRLVTSNGVAIGYAHAFDAAADGALRTAVPAGAWLCELFIGEEAHRGRGYWSRALELLVAEVDTTTLATAIAVVVPVRDERVARAAERCGFRWHRILHDGSAGPSWVMLRERGSAVG